MLIAVYVNREDYHFCYHKISFICQSLQCPILRHLLTDMLIWRGETHEATSTLDNIDKELQELSNVESMRNSLIQGRTYQLIV